ncbi:MAG: carbon-phosphorus lyase complex subunit PhnI [Candidatus Thiodiazotropha sp. (ex. Lucinisca nassula)]|nr:carbon-phosphorus lyase complex subunit PhnI [Candidatus Thiodiazotropha sp. (ex. Lucinisca nassula)]MBW9263031.1 carbon-phosphorus lyase complex subunit PhnI [Candidatus Thiodiazotropha sp. (ex. Lucinisca nassula)]MBW9269127.1 carbon-phosphorus lyase complex subunit PhnI [Candidatus Thiodiazotropha sp. (ex. Lucinisca nassula)]MCG7865776.1 carbon-phosphorus lyase complex subunit PhnI [Candidatus Thiodiazotropha taylori]
MAYVAIKGGAQAIEGSKLAYDYLRSRQGENSLPLDTSTIENQLRLLHSRVISEGGVYHPKLASLAIKQAQGDTLEAAFALRAYRSTMPRLAETEALDTSRMRITRRISSAFKDIPGGQMLGATTDYHLRLMRMELLDESAEAFMAISRSWFEGLDVAQIPDSFPKVLDGLRQQGLLAETPQQPQQDQPFDITREPLIFPVPRSAALATMTRSEQGSLLALAYSNMRGYGDVHPTVAELRVGFVPVMLPHPISGKPMEIGEVEITECEVVAMYESDEQGGKPSFTLGYGACFGHNEVKAISMAILDRSLQKGMQSAPSNPSEDPEFVLLHIDGIDSMGFCTHYKMPHYVTFQSDMDRLRATQNKHAAEDQKS